MLKLFSVKTVCGGLCRSGISRSTFQSGILKFTAPPNIQTVSQRTILLEVPDQNIEASVLLENFDELYPTIRIPHKMCHKDKREKGKEFIRYRLEQYRKRMTPIEVTDYKEIYDHMSRGEERDKTINAITLILDYYNRILCSSIFCPSSIPVSDMRRMLKDYGDYVSRLRYLNYLFVREFDIWRKEIAHQEQKEKAKKEEEEEMANWQIGCFNERGEIQYGFWRNTLFSRYFEVPLQKLTLNRLRVATQFGQELVVDCSFDETMADYETISVARQMSSIYRLNRYSKDPFNLLFTGYREHNRGYQHASRMIKPLIDRPGYCFNLYQKSYRDLLPNERFIYLSPDAPEVMTAFDHNAVYIIGALVSKTHPSRFTYEKATAEGIQCLRLPIEQYVELKLGVKKILSFQGVFQILLELKEHGDWERAFRAGIMSHKLADENEGYNISD